MQRDFAREVLGRLPLAEAVLTVWRWVVDPLFLLSLFARHRGAGYEKVLSFATVVQLMADALVEHRGSGRQSCTRAREHGQLEASGQAVYQKLGRVPLGLSEAWLAESTERVRPVYPPTALPPCRPRCRSLGWCSWTARRASEWPSGLNPCGGAKGAFWEGKRWWPWS